MRSVTDRRYFAATPLHCNRPIFRNLSLTARGAPPGAADALAAHSLALLSFPRRHLAHAFKEGKNSKHNPV